ncbi:hypothetical protein [Chamaesiphon sp. VAR_48_metabat_403]|uniref:hypothetical protein n=1 Tax=Chamaesiphon sp. VAR_48_metabat_403 TaxID=2964700 RepID=UPI00286DBCFC|nr:hypothetical protein [Chamaesiphon sp. VAR_48_metabat_403]
MNFSSKFTLAIATASILCPLAAVANPVSTGSTGSTAAAVSIKFQDCKCGPTSGNFSINPGGNASGGGNGVQELSAAVATGETKAKAEASSKKSGTNASAYGYSKPVSFSYETYSDVSNKKYRSEYTQNSEYQKEAAIEFAASQKKSESESEYDTASVDKKVRGGRGYYDSKGKYIEYSRDTKSGSESESSSSRNVELSAKLEASASQSSASKKSSESANNESGTNYKYTGSSVGLSYIPAIVK